MRFRIGRDWWRCCWGVVGLSLILVSRLATAPPAWSENNIPSLHFHASDLPLAVLAAEPSVRIEKRAQSHRLSVQKPERGARISFDQRTGKLHPRPTIHHAFQTLPRRALPAGHATPLASDDPSDSFLS